MARRMMDIDGTEENFSFSFRKLLLFFGPGLLISIAYLDPGNIESDFQSGLLAKYRLIWVILISNILALIVQRLALRIGNVSGFDLAQMCYIHYKLIPRLFLWFMVEISIIAADTQEVIGTAVALHMLSGTRISLAFGMIYATFGTLLILILDRLGIRKLEYLFVVLVAIMTASFGYQVYEIGPNLRDMSTGLIPSVSGWSSEETRTQAFGIIGSIIMPRNLFLHSALVQTKKVNRKYPSKIREANIYLFVEAAFSLFVSFIINVLVVAIFAEGLYGKTNLEIIEQCKNSTLYEEAEKVFVGDSIRPDVYNAGIFLGCSFGVSAMYIWAIGLFAAGQSATMAGTLSGQYVLQGFLNLKCQSWVRVLGTRGCAILITFGLVFYFKDGKDFIPNTMDLTNTIMVLQLPFALIPTIAFSSSKAIMGEFANGRTSRTLALFISVFVILTNVVFTGKIIMDAQLEKDHFIAIAVGAGAYIAFNIYLIVHMCCAMGCRSAVYERLTQHFGNLLPKEQETPMKI